MTRSRDEQAGRSYDRFNIHEMCRQEPELDYVHSKSYGEGSFWFLRVTAMGDEHCAAEAVVCSSLFLDFSQGACRFR